MDSLIPMDLVNQIVMLQRPIYPYMIELNGLIDALSLTDNPITDIQIIIQIANFMRANYIKLYDDLF